MNNAVKKADQQGDLSDDQRIINAMHTFVNDFGLTAATYMESCVKCGLCAEACQFYVTTGDPKYTPINKIKPFQQAYQRHMGPFAPVYRLLNLVPAVTLSDLKNWQELIYDSCTLCGRCTLICPMGIDIAELVKEARHGMFEAGLIPSRLALMDRTTVAWGSPATPAEDFADIIEEISQEFDVPINVDKEKAEILITLAPAELGDHTKAVADIAKILNSIDADWTLCSDGFEASNIGFINGDLALQEKLTMNLIATAERIGAKTLVLPECGHAYGAARWEAARWYGGPVPVNVVHMTEFLGDLVSSGKIKLNEVDETASFHDPCQLVRRGGVTKAPREIMTALGLDLIEMEDSGSFGWCCGGGGGVISNARASGLRHKVFDLKKKQFEETGAKRLVTACGQCRITLTMGAKHINWKQKTDSLLELVADNLVT
jgi:Fe-S oxidoreductase